MKRIIGIVVLLLLCSCTKDQSLPLGYYTYDAQNPMTSIDLTLEEKNHFVLSPSPLSSHLCVGSYSIKGDTLSLIGNDGHVFVFLIDNSKVLHFDQNASSQSLIELNSFTLTLR